MWSVYLMRFILFPCTQGGIVSLFLDIAIMGYCSASHGLLRL